jgi:HPt (histidine-containing phosphotransfer) domain-containing protein
MPYLFADIRDEVLARIGGNRQTLRNLMDIFPGEANSLLNTIEKARTAGNTVDVALHANTLIGICRMFAATSAARAASELEAVALAGSLGSDELLERLNAKVKQVIDEVQKCRVHNVEGDALR